MFGCLSGIHNRTFILEKETQNFGRSVHRVEEDEVFALPVLDCQMQLSVGNKLHVYIRYFKKLLLIHI